MKYTRLTAILAACSALTSAAQGANLVGLWSFESGSLSDSTGNYGDLKLYGNASIVNGALDVNGSASAASGWASTPGGLTSTLNAGNGGGVALGSKTLVTWITLQSLSSLVRAGSAMTLDSVTTDKFDGIVFAERANDRWMNGSSNWTRSPANQFSQASALETTTGSLFQLAITYEVSGSNVTITGYRDGVLMGSYVSGGAATWTAGDQEVIFGARHISPPTAAPPGVPFSPTGGLDALIHEARIYDGALTQAEIASLAMVPEPGVAALGMISVALLGMRRRRA